MTEDSVKGIVVVLLNAINFLIIVPTAIYWFIKFIQISSLLMIKKRYPRLLKAVGFLIITWFTVGFPAMIFDFLEYPFPESSTFHEAFDRIAYTVTPICGMGIFVILSWRFWHMYYDLMRASTSEKNDQWKIHLDSSLAQKHKDNDLFWLKNGKTYGSKQWTKKIVAAYYTINTSIIIALYQYFINTNSLWIPHYVSVLFYSIVLLFTMYLAWKVPRYADHFFLKDEMKLTLYALCTAVLWASIATVCFLITSSQWFMTAMVVVGGWTLFTTGLVSFWWIPKRVCAAEMKLKEFQETVAAQEEEEEEEQADKEKKEEDEEELGASKELGKRRASIRRGSVTGSEIVLPTQDDVEEFVRRMSNAGNVRRMSEKDNRNANTRRPSKVSNMMSSLGEEEKTVDVKMDLPDILHDDEAFAIFMSHLAKDFSTEYLVCFIEIMQYKFLMKQRFDIIDPTAIDTSINFDIEYPLNGIAPLSEINKEEFEFDLSKYRLNDDPQQLIKECKMVCFKIFKKYIETGAELKIKILEPTKKYILGLMKDESFWMGVNSSPQDLFTLYDETLGEIISVLNAFPAFQTACKSLDNKK